MAAVVESITQITVTIGYSRKIIIRIWREEEEVLGPQRVYAAHSQLQTAVDRYFTSLGEAKAYWDRRDLIKVIEAVGRINAIEIKDGPDLDGVVYYPEWP